MKCVDTIARIRREFFVRGKTIKEIVRELHVSRNTVRKVLRSGATEFTYEREVQPLPKLGRWKDELDRLLLANEAKPARERLTLIRVFEALRASGYEGGYDAVRRYARTRRRETGTSSEAYVPLTFAPGEAYQFDWSHEVVLINGTTVIVKVAHVRLCHSRMLFVRAYPRETQEMVFDAHDRAFAFFKGACTRGIYDNMKTAVETIFAGKERIYNRRFLQMCSHFLVDPVACTPASGWEKGQVENQVGLVRERFFAPRLRVKSYDELNAWLLDQAIAYAKAHRHPELKDQTVWQVFEAERANLVPYPGRFDGFHAVPASVSKTCLVRFDNNRYSVAASAVGRPAACKAVHHVDDPAADLDPNMASIAAVVRDLIAAIQHQVLGDETMAERQLRLVKSPAVNVVVRCDLGERSSDHLPLTGQGLRTSRPQATGRFWLDFGARLLDGLLNHRNRMAAATTPRPTAGHGQ